MTASSSSTSTAAQMNGSCMGSDAAADSGEGEESSHPLVYTSTALQQQQPHIQQQQNNSEELWLKCPVCDCVFNDPWLLRCLHTVCATCFDSRAEHEGRNECPVCLERDVFGHMKVRPDYAVRRCILSTFQHESGNCSDVCVGVGVLDGGGGSLDCGQPAVAYCLTCASDGGGAAESVNSTAGRYLCTSCLVLHLEMNRSHRVQSVGERRALTAAAAARFRSGDTANGRVESPYGNLTDVGCWLHGESTPLHEYCTACQLPMCAVCVESHPPDHRRLPLDAALVADELAAFCSRVDSHKRKAIDMRRLLLRQMRRLADAHDRCRRLLDEHHELLTDVLLPTDRTRLAVQLADAYRRHRGWLDKFGERALTLADSVTHVAAVVERHMQLSVGVEVLALRRPAEARIAAVSRRIDEHFAAEQQHACLLVKSSGELARDLLRTLYRPVNNSAISSGLTALPACVDAGRVLPLQQQQQPQLAAVIGRTVGGAGDMLGALNGFGSCSGSGSSLHSSHGSSPELSLDVGNSRGSSSSSSAAAAAVVASTASGPAASAVYEPSLSHHHHQHQHNYSHHNHHAHQQQQQMHHFAGHQQHAVMETTSSSAAVVSDAEQHRKMAIMSDLSALLGESSAEGGCGGGGSERYVRPFSLQQSAAGVGGECLTNGGRVTAGGQRLHSSFSSHLAAQSGGGGALDMTSVQMELPTLEAAVSNASPVAANGTSSMAPAVALVNGTGGGGAHMNGCGLGQSILSGVGMERTFNTSFDSGFSGGRYSPYSTACQQQQQYSQWSSGVDCADPGGRSSLMCHQAMSGGVGGVVSSVRSSDSSCGSLTPVAAAATAAFPPRGQVRRQKMIYNVKLGEFGVMEGQFTEPSGVAVNARNEIIVADTNNHRIQVFDKEGRFQFSFGECGKREGQLLYPNRVFVNKQSGDIVVTERSPTHQIQIYNQYGAFVRKFGADILQHPRGVTVDSKNRIVVVECKVMRVLVFDYNGEVIKRFGCSRHLEFPNGVAVNECDTIFISDNRAHCVKVFNYDGAFLRKIGGEGITNYPIGVGINQLGQVVVADNHNNFNLTVFAQDGQIVSALESKVKHAQCFDMALMDGGSVVLASKDYRLYVYRYAPVPSQQTQQQQQQTQQQQQQQQTHHHQHLISQQQQQQTQQQIAPAVGYPAFAY